MRAIACVVAFGLCLGCREVIKVPIEESRPEPVAEETVYEESEVHESSAPKEVFWTGLVSVNESVREYEKECDERGECCYFWPSQTVFPEARIGSVDLSNYSEAWVEWDGDPAELLAGFGSLAVFPSGDISSLCGKGFVNLVARFELTFPAGEYCTIAQAAFESHTRKSARLGTVKVFAR